LLGSNIEPIFGNNRKGDIEHSNANINLAKNILNYEPIVSFDEGIKKTINY
jgi:nucleoside-diphosphate-sugar epimerase